MKCPWLVRRIVDTETKTTSYNTTKRVEHEEFDKCLKADCPFYITKTKTKENGTITLTEHCGRAMHEMEILF